VSKSLLFTLFLTVCAATCAGQQGQASAGFSPVPTITADTIVPEDSPQYVFLGPTIYDITLSYPEDLASGKRSGPRRTYKLKMLNNVSPIVTTVVTANADGSFDYAYAVQDDLSARDAIRVWSIAMPAVDAADSTAHPVWRASSEPARGHAAAPPGAVSMTPVVFVAWREPKGSAIGRGAAVQGFHIKSFYRPGPTLLYARSDEDFAVPADLPQEVLKQLEPLRSPEWRDRAVLVTGPRFPKEWGRDIVSGEFKNGIARLVAEGRLKPDSKFVKSVNPVLDALSLAGGASVPLDAALSLAADPTELDLAHAIAISLK